MLTKFNALSFDLNTYRRTTNRGSQSTGTTCSNGNFMLWNMATLATPGKYAPVKMGNITVKTCLVWLWIVGGTVHHHDLTRFNIIYIQIWYYIFCTRGWEETGKNNKQTRKRNRKNNEKCFIDSNIWRWDGSDSRRIRPFYVYTASHARCRIVVPIHYVCAYCGKSTTNCRRIMINRSHERKKNSCTIKYESINTNQR